MAACDISRHQRHSTQSVSAQKSALLCQPRGQREHQRRRLDLSTISTRKSLFFPKSSLESHWDTSLKTLRKSGNRQTSSADRLARCCGKRPGGSMGKDGGEGRMSGYDLVAARHPLKVVGFKQVPSWIMHDGSPNTPADEKPASGFH